MRLRDAVLSHNRAGTQGVRRVVVVDVASGVRIPRVTGVVDISRAKPDMLSTYPHIS